MAVRIRSLFPRSLYGRAALILVAPIVTIQLLVSVAFIQRHFEGVTEQMTSGVVLELMLVQAAAGEGLAAAQAVAEPLGLVVQAAGDGPASDAREFSDFSGLVVQRVLREGLAGVQGVDLLTYRREVLVRLDSASGPVEIRIERRRVSASNPHQLLVLMVLASLLLTVIAYVFLRNQLRPIKRMAEAAEAFGKGRIVPYRPRGAEEVRAAGAAFLDMRARIERQIEQRTLMLSGVSHDLRTPLTRMRLELAMLDPSPEVAALQSDVAEMERMLDAFLAFARGDATEQPVTVDPGALVAGVVTRARRAGLRVVLTEGPPPPPVVLRPDSVARAVENLLNNAGRYADNSQISLSWDDSAFTISVEDDGPGIPADRRDEAMRPFTRLDSARDPNRGGGVGLGLAIAADVAHGHGGALRLGHSTGLGGLKADLVLAR
ncbi:MAG: ATP-binding protein [Gemmobacter sp.]|nr:ATP-binding protein [Gemmobacter sp.]